MKTMQTILSGSCEPATELLALVEFGGADAPSALAAYNARLFPRDRVVSLLDAAQAEQDCMKRLDC